MTNLKKLEVALAIIVLGAIALALQFSTPNIADPDSFYHITHAKIYRERGIFYGEFPWTQFSVMKDLKADIWWGFHLFLIPFTFVKDGILGIKLAGAFVTFLTLAGFYWVLRRLKTIWPFLWTLIFTAAAADVMYRLTMTRPHNLSLVLALAVFALIFTNGRKTTFAALGIISSFLHAALSWLPIFVVLVSNLIFKIRREPVQWKNTLCLALGSIIGLLARPQPWGALKLVYIQVVNLTIAKVNGLPLTFGRELKPPAFDSILRNTAPLLLILTAALIFYKIARRSSNPESANQKNIFFSALAIGTIFFFITTFMARRSYDIFAGFSIIAAASALTLYINNREIIKQRPTHQKSRRIIISFLIIAVGLLGLNSIPVFKKYNDTAWIPTHLKESALWLKENSEPGEIVFHTSWDQFGSLFFWNQQNYYINGMDPIFMYAYNPSLYWKNHFMFTTDEAYNQTCGKIRCTQEEAEDTARVLANDFKASYVVLRKAQNPKTYFFWLKENKFPLVFENQKEAVFKIPPL